jgi:hypothetical protein
MIGGAMKKESKHVMLIIGTYVVCGLMMIVAAVYPMSL